MVERPHGDHGADGATVSILELLEHLQGRLAEGGFSQAQLVNLLGWLAVWLGGWSSGVALRIIFCAE